MEEKEEYHLKADWDTLLKMYQNAWTTPVKTGLVPFWNDTDKFIEAGFAPTCGDTNNFTEISSLNIPLVVGQSYAYDIVERSAIIHWRVMCVETCCNDSFWEGLEYNAVEIKGGVLFVKNDDENYVYVKEDCFAKEAKILTDQEQNRGEVTFGIDSAYSNGFNKRLVLDEKTLAEEIKFANLQNKAELEIDNYSKLIVKFLNDARIDDETAKKLLDDNLETE